MVRLFSLLSAFAVLMILVVGGGIYWLSAAQVGQARQDSATTAASSLAANLTEQINMRINTVEKMAQDPEVVAAVISADPGQLTAAAEKLERHLPGVLKIRLLLPGISELDNKSVPRMGYADLDMVRETFSKDQLPAIQGDMGPDRHLAITRRIMHNGQAVGVILASLAYDFVNKTVQATALNDGYVELKQGALALAAVGEVPAEEESADAQKITLANTGWELRYQVADTTNSSNLMVIFAVIIVPALLVLAAFFIGYRKLSQILTEDLGCVLKASKDMMTNKLQGTYPVKLAEMDAVVSTLVQFKRVLDSEGIEIPDHDTGDAQMNRFFDGFDDPLNTGGSMLWGGDEPAPVAAKNEASAPVSFNKPDIIETTVPDSFDMPMTVTKTADTGIIFRAYDIRGIVGKTLTKDVVYDIGRALGTQAKEQGCKTMVVGRDGRTSSPALAEALAKGLISTGLNVLDIGMVPTPVLYFVAKHTEGRSGVMITGSHNPADYNGLKMVINGETLANQKIQQLKGCIDNAAYATGNPGSIEENSQYSNEYIGLIDEDIHIARPLTVVLDCGNGVAGELGPKLLKTLGCNVVELFCDIDGNFPNHHPDPSNPKNLTELIATVKHYKADLGIAFDGDGDRLGIVDSSGKIIWPDRQMMLFAKDVLAGKPGAEIIYDVKCSRHLPEQITKFGGRPTMWKTGHSLIKAKLKETGAKLAGEMSGHIFFNDRWFGFDDALYSAARLLEIISRDTRSSAEVFADFPDSINTPELNVALEEGENFIFIERLLAAAHFTDGKIIDIDGMRVDFADGWGLVRASNTTPSLVIRFEADSDEAMRRIQQQFGDLMKTIKPNINLPF
ncbi:MAG: phosphomannomutase/phosphoglucomutase [Methylobacter sp.]|nr:phosphomannomutase/phosphoglucomutase [Methylobacter sp.]MDP2428160.1 phosphomannomutase/phosphoglucomutase [Methylobacter sp.]MDP3054372.1 phosphomannomutase/phosphoglucomutase [Methylobacter sp.]MDP3362492.1 phosphomannomutase/phosphoglucomutase [Methylobacter sp.]MDZ4219986.1 phosphomannomutase/phosphoglucomutase [Methylobacter sp.]